MKERFSKATSDIFDKTITLSSIDSLRGFRRQKCKKEERQEADERHDILTQSAK